MSLKGKKKKKRMTFKEVSSPRGSKDEVGIVQTDENGMIEARYIVPKDWDKKNMIDILTHEFSEDAVATVIDREGKSWRPLSTKTVERQEKGWDRSVSHTIPHAMVSHHTESGVMVDGKVKWLTPEEFEKHFYIDGRIEKTFPRSKFYLQKWRAIEKFVAKAGTYQKRRQILNQLKSVRDEAKPHVPITWIESMDSTIKRLELSL